VTGSTARKVAGAAGLIALITVAARVAGFGRTAVFLRTVGAGCVGNTYQTANTVPNILFEIAAGGALASLVVPLLAPLVGTGAGIADRTTVARTASALLSWTMLVLAPLAVLVAVFARPIVALLLGDDGSCPGAVDLGTRMLVVFAPQVVLYGIGVVLAGVLQSHERFAAPALAPLLSSLTVIAVYLLYRARTGGDPGIAGLTRGDELILSVGTTVGVAVLTLSLLVPLRGLGLRLVPTLRFPPGAARLAGRLAGAGIAVVGAQQVSVAVAVALANSGTPAGTYVVYATAMTVFLLPWAVLAVPLATSVFPRLAGRHAAGDRDGFRRATAGTVRAVLVVTLAATAVLVAAAEPAARVLVQGAGGADQVIALADGIAAFGAGLAGYGLVALLSRALYAGGGARPAAGAQVVGWLVVVGADVALAAALPAEDRVVALAAGNAVGVTVAAALLLAALVRRFGGAAVAGVGRSGVVAVAAALLAGGAGRLLANAWSGGGVAAALVQCVVVGLATAAVFATAAAPVVGPDLRRALGRPGPAGADRGRRGEQGSRT
jgi:putative peptidoglycan lipid II flippase